MSDQRHVAQGANGRYPVQPCCKSPLGGSWEGSTAATCWPRNWQRARLVTATRSLAPGNASTVAAPVQAGAGLGRQARRMVASMVMEAVGGGYREEITAEHQPPCRITHVPRHSFPEDSRLRGLHSL